MKKYFITGLLVLVPLFITLWVLGTVIGTMDQSLLLLPEAWVPKKIFGFKIHGLGALLTLVIIFVTGVIATNIFGQQLIALWESLLTKVPFVKTIYSSVKQVSDTLFSVYVPTTPNPTSGFFLMLPKSDVIELEMSVDEALKYIISMGTVAPKDAQKEIPIQLVKIHPTQQPSS
jgi:uncharacterized membrane protein